MDDSNDKNLCLSNFTVKLIYLLGFNAELAFGSLTRY